MTTLERFWGYVDKTDKCWHWAGTITHAGYGTLGSNWKRILAHRYSYELHKGTIPKHLQLDHLCRNRKCVNPDHLEPVTHRENGVRGVLARGKKNGLPIGVSKNRYGKYEAMKKFRSKSFYLGTYATPEEASAVYESAVMIGE